MWNRNRILFSFLFFWVLMYIQKNTQILCVQFKQFWKTAHPRNHHLIQRTEHFHHPFQVLPPRKPVTVSVVRASFCCPKILCEQKNTVCSHFRLALFSQINIYPLILRFFNLCWEPLACCLFIAEEYDVTHCLPPHLLNILPFLSKSFYGHIFWFF